jgi:hypothetical protein
LEAPYDDVRPHAVSRLDDTIEEEEFSDESDSIADATSLSSGTGSSSSHTTNSLKAYSQLRAKHKKNFYQKMRE